MVKSSKDLLRVEIGDAGMPWQHRPLGLSQTGLEKVSGSQEAWWMELPALPSESALMYATQRNGDNAGLVVPIYSAWYAPQLNSSGCLVALPRQQAKQCSSRRFLFLAAKASD